MSVKDAPDSPGSRGLSRWWSRLSTRTRERVLLGTLVGVSLAARDLLLFASSAGMFALLEAAELMEPAPHAGSAA